MRRYGTFCMGMVEPSVVDFRRHKIYNRCHKFSLIIYHVLQPCSGNAGYAVSYRQLLQIQCSSIRSRIEAHLQTRSPRSLSCTSCATQDCKPSNSPPSLVPQSKASSLCLQTRRHEPGCLHDS